MVRVSAQKQQHFLRGLESALGQNKTECTLFSGFKPKRGGQAKFWDYVKLTEINDIEPRFLLVKGGIGGGKSYAIGAAFACSRALLEPESRGLISANDYGQLESSTLVSLAEFCRDFGIPLSPWCETPEETARAIASRRLCKIGEASVLVLSANKFGGDTKRATQGGRGLQIRWFWGDEWLYASRSAFETVNGRLGRGQVLGEDGQPLKLMKGLGVITSTINRNDPYNWGWDFFDDPERDPEMTRLYKSFNLLTADNDSLDSDYVTSLTASYTEELAAIELRGEYATSKEGRVFRYFDRFKHLISDTLVQAATAKTLHISLDFNRSPACAITAIQTTEDELIIVKEWYLLNSDTFELSAAIAQWLYSNNWRSIEVHGDASGNQQTANSKQTNWTIVWNALKQYDIKGRRRYGNANPSIDDTVNAANCALNSSQVWIGECKELVKDLESVKWGNDGKIDKSDIARTHLGDAFRYLVNDLFPYVKLISKPKRQSQPQGIIV